MKHVVLRGAKRPDTINKQIMQLVINPEMTEYEDYPKAAIAACKVETKTLEHELKNFMAKNANVINLETRAQHSEKVKNTKIELIPRLDIRCKVSIKERIAPLQLKFEFFDSLTDKRILNPDAVVCVSPLHENPNEKNATVVKTEFRDDPHVMLYQDL